MYVSKKYSCPKNIMCILPKEFFFGLTCLKTLALKLKCGKKSALFCVIKLNNYYSEKIYTNQIPTEFPNYIWTMSYLVEPPAWLFGRRLILATYIVWPILAMNLG